MRFRRTSLDLLGFSGHGEEDGPEGERAELDVCCSGEEAVDVRGSRLFIETGVDEANDRAGGFGLEPGAGQRRRKRKGGVCRDLDFAEARGERGHFFGEDKFAGFEIADVAREAFNFGKIVGRDEDGGFGGAFEKTLDELIADERIEASEGFVQDDEARVERESGG